MRTLGYQGSFLFLCLVRIANEILMYFRSQRKSSQDVSLSDYIETGTDGAALSLMDVVSDEEDLLEKIGSREVAARCGISRSYVSRIEKRALEKLRIVLQ